MKVEKIDLYSYFNVEKPRGAKGELTVYAVENNIETDVNRSRPAMLIIPGGAYLFVSSREAEPVALAYLYYGFNAFVLDYSVAPVCRYPVQLREAAMAMIFIRQNAKKYCVNPNTVCAVGFSAGGHLCGSLGTMFDRDVLKDLPDFNLIRPDAVILSYPVILSWDKKRTHWSSIENLTGGDEKLIAINSVDKCVNKNSSPAFIWHTVKDEGVPVFCSLAIAGSYNEQGVPFELHLFENGPHGLSLATAETAPCGAGGKVYKNTADAEWVKLSVTWLKNRGFCVFR